jgi:transposase InsO family protein
MKLFHLEPLRQRKKPFKPEDLNQAPMNIPNLLKEIVIDAPNIVYASDFTYLPYFNKFVYLATIEDAFTREIIGWEVSTRHNTDLVAKAMTNALQNHPVPKLAHSDQGSEYRSRDYLKLLNCFNIRPSMSQKASPWQNSKQESFYSEFKLELGHPEIYPTLGELIEAIALQIHYYNHERIHTALHCPPTVFATRFTKIQKIQKNLIFQDTSNILSV